MIYQRLLFYHFYFYFTFCFYQVLWMAEKCAATIAMVLKPEQVIHLVSTIITTEPYPLNMGAIKMLHKVVEHWGRDAIEPHLTKVMPGLIKVS